MWARAVWGSVLLGLSGTAGAHHLPAGVAEETVRQFVELFNFEILFTSGRLAPYQTHAADSDDPIVALHQMLDGTGLKYSFLSPRIIAVDPDTPEPQDAPSPQLHAAVVILPRRRTPRATARPALCICSQSLGAEGWIDGPWCQYEDGRKEWAPDRCPLPDPYKGDSGSKNTY